jgi:hypothetical protein
MAIFQNLNPKLTNPESLVTMAAYMPLSKKPKYNTSTAGQILKYVPIVALIKAFKKDPLGNGERLLGERFLDHIQGLNVGRGDVTVEVYNAAVIFFTIMFGVPIKLHEDFDALDKSAEDFMKRPGKEGVPRIAVDRAVKLKKSYYPASSYNQGAWNLNYAENNPLVAPIPGIEPGTLYNGEIPGTGYAENGIPRSLDQEAEPAPTNPKTSTPTGNTSVNAPGTPSTSTLAPGTDLAPQNQAGMPNWMLYSIIGVGAVIVIGGIIYIVRK